MNDAIVVLVTASSETEAKSLAKLLLEQKLIACANFVPVQSVFMWEGEMKEEAEVLMILKTRSSVFKDKLVHALQATHSYDVPEIIAMPIVLGSTDYLQWIYDEVPE